MGQARAQRDQARPESPQDQALKRGRVGSHHRPIKREFLFLDAQRPGKHPAGATGQKSLRALQLLGHPCGVPRQPLGAESAALDRRDERRDGPMTQAVPEVGGIPVGAILAPRLPGHAQVVLDRKSVV